MSGYISYLSFWVWVNWSLSWILGTQSPSWLAFPNLDAGVEAWFCFYFIYHAVWTPLGDLPLSERRGRNSGVGVEGMWKEGTGRGEGEEIMVGMQIKR